MATPRFRRCIYWTGNYEGACGAGVVYATVADQNLKGQQPRYPCQPATESFTTCARYEEDELIKRFLANIGRPVKLSDTGYASKRDDAVLLAVSRDARFAFVEIEKRGRKIKSLVGLHVVHFTRKTSRRSRGKKAAGAVIDGREWKEYPR